MRYFTTVTASVMALVACGLVAGPVAAQDRARLLEFYPCASLLEGEALAYLADWANAIKIDPCGLSGTEFMNNFGQPMVENDVVDDYAATAVQHIRTYFDRRPKGHLYMYQVLMFGPDNADGLWGPMTEARLMQDFSAYDAIGGRGDDWAVTTPFESRRFLAWLEAAIFATVSGGEFPD